MGEEFLAVDGIKGSRGSCELKTRVRTDLMQESTGRRSCTVRTSDKGSRSESSSTADHGDSKGELHLGYLLSLMKM